MNCTTLTVTETTLTLSTKEFNMLRQLLCESAITELVKDKDALKSVLLGLHK